MLCGIIDTSGPVIELGFTEEANLLVAHRYSHTKENAQHIASLFDCSLKNVRELGIKTDITYLAVGVGPGSFIGSRSGVAFANGYAVARGIPIIPIGSMWSRAVDILLRGFTPIVIRNAHRNSFYLGYYSRELKTDPPNGVISEAECNFQECINFICEKAQSATNSEKFAVYTDSKSIFDEVVRVSTYSNGQIFLVDSIVSIRGMAYLAQKLIAAGKEESFADVLYLRPAI